MPTLRTYFAARHILPDTEVFDEADFHCTPPGLNTYCDLEDPRPLLSGAGNLSTLTSLVASTPVCAVGHQIFSASDKHVGGQRSCCLTVPLLTRVYSFVCALGTLGTTSVPIGLLANSCNTPGRRQHNSL